jgi:hypothetical protein
LGRFGPADLSTVGTGFYGSVKHANAGAGKENSAAGGAAAVLGVKIQAQKRVRLNPSFRVFVNLTATNQT